MIDSRTIKICFKTFSLVGLDVLIDGKKVGKVASGEVKDFEVGSGQHTVRTKTCPFSSQALDVDMDSNSSAMLECTIPDRFWKRLLLVIVIGAFSRFIHEFHTLMITQIFDILAISVGVWFVAIGLKAGESLALTVASD